jgi:predicted nuclease of predicted toxin-antitoxin system
MRFLADENIHADVIREFRQANCEVFSVQDVGLSGHKDHEILEYSEKQD